MKNLILFNKLEIKIRAEITDGIYVGSLMVINHIYSIYVICNSETRIVESFKLFEEVNHTEVFPSETDEVLIYEKLERILK